MRMNLVLVDNVGRKHILLCDNANCNGFRHDGKLLPEVKQYKMLVTLTAECKRIDYLNEGYC